jgi:hypothetical protein
MAANTPGSIAIPRTAMELIATNQQPSKNLAVRVSNR